MNTSPAQFLALCTVLALSLVTAVHPVVAQSVAQSAAPLLLPPSLVPQITINALMKDTIDPAASALWTAVSYTATVEGITETMPETEEDWNALRARADELIKAGALLMLPGLKVNDLSVVPPDFQYSPAEIEQLVQQDPGLWRNYAERMQTTVLQLMEAIDRRDLVAYTELGPPINQACEGCHGQYWYRPMPR